MTDELLQATVSVRCVLTTIDDEILLVERASDGEWELPGGRLGPDEDVTDGLKREVHEETALEVTIEKPIYANAWQNGDDDGRFAVYYRCRTTDQGVSLSPEHESSQWIHYSDAAAYLPDPQVAAVYYAQRDGNQGVASELPPPATSD